MVNRSMPQPPRPDLRTEDSSIASGPPGATAPAFPSLPDGRPKVTWRWWQALIAFVVTNLVIAQAFVGGLIALIAGVDVASGPAGAGVLGLTIVTNAVWMAGLIAWLENRHKGWRDAIRLVPAARRVREAGVSFALGLGLYPAVAIGAGLIVATFLEVFTDRAVSAPEQIATDLSFAGKLFAVMVALVAAPVAKELFFRGVLFRSIRDRHGFWPGALLSSLVFGLVHYVPSPWPDALFLQTLMVFTGVSLCLIYEWRKSLLSTIVAHMAFNSIGIVLILASG
jgi:membrane protease YdiL (CAAX protease family)